jgi:GNAT superfamily N-acetyltransferase
MTLTVRPLTHADRADWLVLWHGYLTFYKHDLPQAITDLTWGRLLDPAEPAFGFGAFVGGRMVGMVTAVLHRSSWLAGFDCYLEDLFVAEAARGHGAGGALIAAVMDEGRRRGADRIYWRTAQNNPARKLYDRVATEQGHVVYGRDL